MENVTFSGRPESLNFFDSTAPAKLRPSVTITFSTSSSISAAGADGYGSDSESYNWEGDSDAGSTGASSSDGNDDYSAAMWEEIKKHSVPEG